MNKKRKTIEIWIGLLSVMWIILTIGSLFTDYLNPNSGFSLEVFKEKIVLTPIYQIIIFLIIPILIVIRFIFLIKKKIPRISFKNQLLPHINENESSKNDKSLLSLL